MCNRYHVFCLVSPFNKTRQGRNRQHPPSKPPPRHRQPMTDLERARIAATTIWLPVPPTFHHNNNHDRPPHPVSRVAALQCFSTPVGSAPPAAGAAAILEAASGENGPGCSRNTQSLLMGNPVTGLPRISDLASPIVSCNTPVGRLLHPIGWIFTSFAWLKDAGIIWDALPCGCIVACRSGLNHLIKLVSILEGCLASPALLCMKTPCLRILVGAGFSAVSWVVRALSSPVRLCPCNLCGSRRFYLHHLHPNIGTGFLFKLSKT